MLTPCEQKELEELLHTAEKSPKSAPAADGRRAAIISADAKELKSETCDKDLSREVVAKPTPPKEPLTGRWLTGFEQRHETERRLAPAGGGKAETVETYRATGTVKIAGRTVSADGLVARSGRRRILPEATDVTALEDKAEQLALVARRVLHGRNATVFEGRVLAPLLGRPKRSVKDLAAQFGVTPDKIYKIVERCKERVLKVYEQFSKLKITGDRCPTCGRVYDEWNFGQCGRNNGAVQDRHVGPTWLINWSGMRWPSLHLHPECLPYAYWGDAAQLQKKYLRR